jgi:hypothetical protein
MIALGQIAEIQLGYTFRSSLEPSADGPTRVIQMRDLGDDHLVDLESADRTATEVPASHQARRDDIIFRSRGDRSTCAIVATDPGCAVVAAPLLRLRVTDKRVLPAYLNWFINQPAAQAHFARHAEGSNVKMVSKTALQDLQVDVPSLERQQSIVTLAGLSGRQRTLNTRIDGLRERLQADIMMIYAKGGATV